MTRARERLLGVLLLLAGVSALAGSALEISGLATLGELTAAIAAVCHDHAHALRPAAGILAGGAALIIGALNLSDS